MDILWAALAICAIVSVVFYVLAISWQRTLRSQAGAIRGLIQRLETLEAMEDPVMRRRISELMPSPLEQVGIFSFRLGDRFWQDTAALTDKQIRRIHEHGTFVGSVKIEIWRSHVTVTLRELPPPAEASGWQTRTVDIYQMDSDACTVLWELCLEPTLAVAMGEPPALELRYRNKSIVLAMRNVPEEPWAVGSGSGTAEERVVFRIPLDAEQLGDFHIAGTDVEAGIETDKDTSIASFADQDERQGVDWQLRLRSFDGRICSGNWTVMEPRRARRVS